MRIDDLPQNTLINDIKGLEADARELKNRQFVSGAHNVISYLNVSEHTWGYDITVGTIGDPIGKEHLFGLFFQTETRFAFGTPYMDIFIDGTSESNRLTQEDRVYNGANGTAVLDVYCDYLIDYFDNDEGLFGWRTVITVFGQVRIRLKYYVRSPNRGEVLRGYTAP